jgi:transcriptional regulator with XRE-family HTH domain
LKKTITYLILIKRINLIGKGRDMAENDISRKVKILFLRKGLTQVDLVKKYGFDKSDISKVIHGVRRTEKVRQAIAQELNLDVKEIFS